MIGAEFLAGPDDLGVEEKYRRRRLGVVFSLGDVDDDDALGHADLHGGEANARRLVHGLQHIVEQPVNFRVDPFDRRRNDPQARIGKGEDRKQGHGFAQG